jgi:DNA-binding SARP family transcriptional activator
MEFLEISFFGRFSAQYQGKIVSGLDVRKVQELLCYLLLNRNRSHLREHLADLLWNIGSEARARSYLRKVLWQLQTALNSIIMPAKAQMLEVDAECIRLKSTEHCWLDIDVFERAYDSVRSIPGNEIDSEQAYALEQAESLYEGEILQGWDQDWCLCERERFHFMYLAMMDKLLDYFEACQAYERGIDYGIRILRFDHAHERTYQKLMRLYYLSGDRTSALREYEHCTEALIDELGVQPSNDTKLLYQQVLNGQLCSENCPSDMQTQATPAVDLRHTLDQLQQLQTAIVDLQRKLKGEIRRLEDALSDSRY